MLAYDSGRKNAVVNRSLEFAVTQDYFTQPSTKTKLRSVTSALVRGNINFTAITGDEPPGHWGMVLSLAFL